MPTHIGFIVDGNRRWAKLRGLDTLIGHKTGFNKLKKIVDYTFEQGVKYITAFVFSTENWDRSQREIDYLMDIYRTLFTEEAKRLNEKNIKINILGQTDKLAPDIIKISKDTEEMTKNNTGGVLNFCFNYGGMWEITEACKKIIKSGENPDNLTPEIFSKYLFHPEVPPVDLIVRTSGEQRLSGFILWRAAYAEFLFLKKFWPAITTKDIDKIIVEYQKRSRRFGK